MKIKGVIDEDFVNYKEPCMTIMFPYCDFKCDKECGRPVCQNSKLATAPIIDIDTSELIERYIHNPITKAICIQGLEPLHPKSCADLGGFLLCLGEKYHRTDPVVIYTGYNKGEKPVKHLKHLYKNIIVKYGRFIPDQKPHYDEVLGVYLASDNQFAEQL